MAVSWQKAFLRDAKTKIWHTVRAAESEQLVSLCGKRFSEGKVPRKARQYDLKSTWPGLALARCQSCVKAGRAS